MTSGLGSLVDADLARESSALEALKVRQQLGVQTLSLANQGPQVLLGLFR
jgi:flagellin